MEKTEEKAVKEEKDSKEDVKEDKEAEAAVDKVADGISQLKVEKSEEAVPKVDADKE